MRSTWRAALLTMSLLLGSGGAAAQGATPSQADLAKAKMLFDAGAQAYSRSKYPEAIQAFTEAYRIAPRPGIVFSIAQAHRKVYILTKKPEHLREAIKHYREYTDKVKQGGRLADVTEALAELEPAARRLDEVAPAGAPPVSAPPAVVAAVETKPLTQLTVTTQTRGALISLDGAKPQESPLIKEVKPGPHAFTITADGYITYVREITLSEGQVVPLDIPLREKPAKLELFCQAGAEVSIDGRLVATTPLLKPLDLSSGRHFVAVTKGGHKPFSQDVDVGRGEKKTIRFKLETTGQRIAAYSSLIGGAVGVGAGVLFAIGALGEQSKAEELLALRKMQTLTKGQLAEYDAARTKRDELRGGAAIGFGAGAAFGAAGLLLYVFDQPPPVAPPVRSDDAPKPQPGAPTGDPSMEVGAAPVVSPGFVGGSVIGRF